VMSYGTLAGGLLTGKFTEQPRFQEGDDRGNFYSFFREPLWPKSAALVEELRKIAGTRSMSQLAINWVVQSPARGDGAEPTGPALRSGPVASALVGAKRPAQVEENAGAADWQLTAEEIGLIESAYARLFKE